VLGTPLSPLAFYRRACPDFIYEPTRPHPQVLALMDTCDVLVLPSIVEGRALVQQEALSRGLPLLVTANAGGEDLIEPGVTGWLVPIRDPAALAERIAWFADHRDQIPAMRVAARRVAAARTWDAYASRIIAAIDALSSHE
jgi:glycosyltransferase involved in cell wall biosynthesis